ncbi:MAG: hypothetical protein IJV39_01735 [Ruminococcus sp.]|nr:hypothetical protein [Ruminococcus sp.]
MLKKPVCPHCKAIYDYKEIKSQKNNSKVQCHNCKKTFTVKKTGGFVLLMSITFVLAIVLNIFMLSVVGVKSLIPLLVITVLLILIALFVQPFFVRYKK